MPSNLWSLSPPAWWPSGWWPFNAAPPEIVPARSGVFVLKSFPSISLAASPASASFALSRQASVELVPSPVQASFTLRHLSEVTI